MIALIALLCLTRPPVEEVRFSNIKFDHGGLWSTVPQAPNLILESTNAAAKGKVRIKVEPAATFEGTLEQGLEAAWTSALGGKKTKGDLDEQEARDIPGGGTIRLRGCAWEPEGGAIVLVVKAKNKLTRLTLTADTELAYVLGATNAGPILMSLEVIPEGGTIGGEGGGGPAPLGPDPSDEFDWDGPDWFEYGVYDHDCRALPDEFNELLEFNRDIVGAVRPRDVTYADALATARKILANPQAKKQYDAISNEDAKKYPKLFLAGAASRMIQGDPLGSLANMLAGIAATPTNPDIQFNLASVLAQNGMPNEALAVLKHLQESGSKPQLAVGLKPDTTMAYLEGYCQMLRGKLPEAAAKLRAATADPFLSEAGLCLALVQAKQGGNGLATYERAAYRFKVEQHVICSESHEDKRPPVDKMFDTSKGNRPILSDFTHPKNWQDLHKWMNEFAPRRLNEIGARNQALSARVLANPRPPFDTPYGMWAEKLSSIMEGLDENEPLILKLAAAVEASKKEVEEAAARHVGRLIKKLQELMIPVEGRHDCPIAKDAIDQCLSAMRPYLVHWETVQRRYAVTWHRMATGLNAHIGKNAWHDCNAASIASQTALNDATIFISIHGFYASMAVALAAIEPKCIEETGSVDGVLRTSDEGPECPSGMKGLGFKYAFEIGKDVKLGFKVDCQKFTVEVEHSLFKVPGTDFGLGGFAQLEMGHKGDWSVFAGAKGSVGAGVGVSEKAGIYVKGNAVDGVKDMGGRVSLDASGKGSEFTVSKSDSMDFSILPSPKTPTLGPGLKTFPNR